MEAAFYLKKLKEDFSRRQRANRSYSLRAFSRDLGIPASTLSQVLLGNRPLPRKSLDSVLHQVPLNARERTRFVESLNGKKAAIDAIALPAEDSRVFIDEAHFQVIAEWEHYAALMLFDCADFDSKRESLLGALEDRFEISRVRAEVVLQNLLDAGLLRLDERGRVLRTQERIRTPEDVSSQALRASHRETLRMAEQKLDAVPVELRDFSSLTVSLDPARLPEAKQIIREFRQKMFMLLQSGRKQEVYQLSIQFFPLTQTAPHSKRRPKK